MDIKTPRRFSITILLTAAVGGLVTLSLALVLFLTALSNFKNTTELLEQSADQTLDAIEREVRDQLEPAQVVVEYFVSQGRRGTLDFSNPHEMRIALAAVLAGAPNLSGIVFWRPDGRGLQARRGVNNQIIVTQDKAAPNPMLKQFFAQARQADAPKWQPPLRMDGFSFVSMTSAIHQNGHVIGFVGAGVSISRLSRAIERSTQNPLMTGFVLYDKTHVLAHKDLLRLSRKSLSARDPLYKTSDLRNQVLAKFAQTPPEPLLTRPKNVNVRVIKAGIPTYLVLSRPFKKFGTLQWYVGVYAKRRDLTGQLRRMVLSIAAGLGLLLLSVFAAIWLARRVARPIKEISDAAIHVGSMELEQIRPLPGSRITELNNQSQAFNKMLEGLRWFEAYVPRKLVNRLMKEKSTDAIRSRQANVTVMFTDIVGFTALSENLPAEQTANLLNGHFEMLNSCIEETEGTLDKYIGDAVMAFWGAPETQEDHARRACLTALKIREKMAQSGTDLRLKIAIHTGSLIVGNIGAKGRMNYTIIGDTVNTCSRMEKLAGELDDGAQVFILISQEVQNQLGGEYATVPVGQFTVKGRKAKVKVHKVV